MAVGPTHLYFRICGIASSGLSRYLYCILPTALNCRFVATIVFQTYDPVIHYFLGVLPAALGQLQHLLFMVFSPETFQSILDDLTSVDKQLEEMGVPIEPQTLSKTMAAALITQLAMVTVELNLWENLAEGVLNVMYVLLMNATVFQQIMLAELIHKRFSALNTQLTRIAASADQTLLQIVETRLDSVFRAHSTLHVIVTDINSHFCIYNILSNASRFYLIAYFLYWNVMALAQNGTVFNSLYAEIMGFIILGFVFQTLTCHLCTEEANRTSLIAHRMLIESSPFSLWEKIGRFSRLALDNRVEFTVGGIFSFDLKLLTKMSAMVFTYVTIAIQLKDVNLIGSEPSNVTTTNTTAN